jgi:hypothetical protein
MCVSSFGSIKFVTRAQEHVTVMSLLIQGTSGFVICAGTNRLETFCALALYRLMFSYETVLLLEIPMLWLTYQAILPL